MPDLKKIIVVKRDGKKVAFDRAKIALAIKKGFDSVKLESGENKYTEKDINNTFNKVLQKIEELNPERLKIEEIQDLIEDALREGYEDVYESFSSYRERRNQSRKLFFDEKKQHKFLKAIENLGSIEDEKHLSSTAMGRMLSYGQTVSNEFSKSYLIKRKFVEPHESGEIYIHDLDYYPMGTTTNCHIDLTKLFQDGFSTGYGYLREPNNIMTYSILSAIAIQANQNDQHGGQSIPELDYYFAPGVVKTFKKEFRQTVYDFLDYSDFGIFAAVNGMEREIDKITTIKFDVSIFNAYCRESEQLKRFFRIAYDKALKKTEDIVYQSMEAFIHNLNTMRSRAGAVLPNTTVNIGTDTSPEGRMITKNFLKALEKGIGKDQKPLYPKTIFKVKNGINFDKKDPNYDLLKLACKVDSNTQLIIYSFLDAKFNKVGFNKEDPDSEVAYLASSIRIYENCFDKTKSTSIGRGNLSTVTINLPRLAIRHKNANGKLVIQEFLNEIDKEMELAKDMLLERYEFQADKRVYNFPFLIGQGNWMDSEKLKPGDRLRRVNKHGSLAIGFVGLAECLIALTGKHHGESQEAQKLGIKIIKHMREKCDQYGELNNLNFVLYATRESNSIEYFASLDKSIYGSKIKGVTDKECYSTGFEVPEDYNISLEDKLEIESKYHELTNGGHISILELSSKNQGKEEVFENTVRKMEESGIGLGKIIIK